jgi:hypothetical protein
MINGVYKFYIDGKYVGEQKNSITKAGRIILLKSIMGLIPSVGGEIHIGVGSAANGSPDADGLIPDNILNFDVASAPVRMSYLDNSGNYDAMVFKASFGTSSNTGEKYKIYELGLFPGSGQQNTTSLLDTTLFSGSTNDYWKEGETPLSVDTTSSTPANSCYITSALTSYDFRIGDTALYIKANDTVAVNNTVKLNSFAFTTYNSVDKFLLAYSKLTGNAPTVSVKFKTTDTDYFLAEFDITGSQTYGIVEKTISEMQTAKVGNPTWSRISEISVTSTANVVIDAIRFNNIDVVDTVYGMVSRAVLDTPIIKQGNSVLDIEYYLSMGFNKTVV